MVPSTRRRFLAATGTAAASLAAGCSFLPPDTSVGDRQLDGWPMGQHDPPGTGHAPDATPPSDDVAVRWRRRFDYNLGLATKQPPVVADGTVYVAGRELLALDAADGSVRFRARGGGRTTPAVATANAYRTPTLVLAGEREFRGLHADGGLAVLGRRFGTTRWRLRDPSTLPVALQAGPVTAPVATDGTVVVGSSGGLAALDASNGQVRWRTTRGSRRPSVRDGVVYAADFARDVVGYDVTTGDRRFRARLDDVTADTVTATPDGLVVGTTDGLLGLTDDGAVDWRFEPTDLDRDAGELALADGVVYGGFEGEDGSTDYLVAVDATTGDERWRSQAAPEKTPQYAPPSVADGVVYVPTEDGGLAAVDAADGHVRWRFGGDSDGGPWSPATLVDDVLYAVGNGHVYALEEA